MVNALNRRHVLKGAAALTFANQVSLARAQSAKVRQSISAANLRPQTLVSYKKAVAAMLALPATDPRNWYRQAIIHTLDCPHGNWWFLPWHRGYLAHFESICRELSGDGDFALPYWDWTATPRIPASMFDDVLSPTHSSFLENFGAFRAALLTALTSMITSATPLQKEWLARRGNPDVESLLSSIEGAFADRQASRRQTPAAPDLPASTAEVVKDSNLRLSIRPDSSGEYPFVQFGSGVSADHYEGSDSGPLESGPHNNIHFPGIRGFMGDFMSPVDPIFWMHHCNIDRIWNIWSRRQQSLGIPEKPTESAWLAEPFPFFNDQNGNQVSSAKAADYSEMASLGYTYEGGSADDLAQPELPFVALSSSEFESTPQDIQGLRVLREVSSSIRIPNALLVAARTDAPDRPAESAKDALNLLARITLKPPSEASNYQIYVFANCPYLSPSTPVNDPHFVGAISFFGASSHGKMHHGNKSEMTYTLPLANTIKQLAEAGSPIRNQIKLQFMTLDDTGVVKELDGALVKTVIRTT